MELWDSESGRFIRPGEVESSHVLFPYQIGRLTQGWHGNCRTYCQSASIVNDARDVAATTIYGKRGYGGSAETSPRGT
jgi:hypothetical protein